MFAIFASLLPCIFTSSLPPSFSYHPSSPSLLFLPPFPFPKLHPSLYPFPYPFPVSSIPPSLLFLNFLSSPSSYISLFPPSFFSFPPSPPSLSPLRPTFFLTSPLSLFPYPLNLLKTHLEQNTIDILLCRLYL